MKKQPRPGLKASSMDPSPYQIARVIRETSDTFTMELSPMRKNGDVSFQPGQFNMLYVFGVGEVPISISGDPSRGKVFVHTTRAVGAVTKAMSALRRADVVGVRGPFGMPWPLQETEGSDVVLIAGGIGLAPLRPALYMLLTHRQRYGKIALLYGTRSPEDLLYRKELERWRSRFDLDIHVTVDRAHAPWKGNVGVVTTLIGKAPFDAHSAVAMVCGPEVMMRFAIHELLKRGIPSTAVYLSMERNMKCGTGLCGHCQFGAAFVCRDGPVFRYADVERLLPKYEI